MRDPFLNTVLPFLANELAAKGGIEVEPCSCPSDGSCLSAEDGPDVIIIIQAMNEDEDDNGSDPAAGFPDYPNYTDEVEGEFDLTDEGQEEIERQENREDFAHLGKIIDNMVYIVGMYTALLQNKVGG